MTEQRILMALGANNNPRNVAWSDQENNTLWTPSTTNQAGSFPLQTGGRLMCGKVLKGGTILLTDIDAWLARWIGGTLVFAFDRLATGSAILLVDVDSPESQALAGKEIWRTRRPRPIATSPTLTMAVPCAAAAVEAAEPPPSNWMMLTSMQRLAK